MADPQRIYPVHHDLEARPTAPLVSSRSTRSEKGDPGTPPPPPFRRTIPAAYSRPPKRRRSCCCRCICWTISLLLLLVIIVAATVGIMFLVFRPKLPKFSIDSMRITQFNIGSSDDTLSATFSVNITSVNPNERIGVYYESGSHVSAWYRGAKLSEGSLPKFYQGHRNTTVLDLAMTGRSSNATSLIASLQQDQTNTGMVPLDLKVDQPVRIKLGALKLPRVKFVARCDLQVDSLSVTTPIRIRSSTCKFRLRL